MQIVQQVVHFVTFTNDKEHKVALDVMKINTIRSLKYTPEQTEVTMNNGMNVIVNLPFNTVLQLVIAAINR